MDDVFGQGEHAVRFEWGPSGATTVRADVNVVVDVLSFTTSVSIAVERGMRVHPCRWHDVRARELADEHDAVLAVGRLEGRRTHPWGVLPSLSPASLLACEPVRRLVLPSPNGSTIAALLDDGGSAVAAGCLRNAAGVAEWLARTLDDGLSVAVVAAGERWQHDDSLRPCLEDHLGAGAVLSHLVALGHGAALSPEARAAAALFDVSAGRLAGALHACAGGRELTAKGFAQDVEVAAELSVSTVVPVLVDGAFVAASSPVSAPGGSTGA